MAKPVEQWTEDDAQRVTDNLDSLPPERRQKAVALLEAYKARSPKASEAEAPLPAAEEEPMGGAEALGVGAIEGVVPGAHNTYMPLGRALGESGAVSSNRADRLLELKSMMEGPAAVIAEKLASGKITKREAERKLAAYREQLGIAEAGLADPGLAFANTFDKESESGRATIDKAREDQALMYALGLAGAGVATSGGAAFGGAAGAAKSVPGMASAMATHGVGRSAARAAVGATGGAAEGVHRGIMMGDVKSPEDLASAAALGAGAGALASGVSSLSGARGVASTGGKRLADMTANEIRRLVVGGVVGTPLIIGDMTLRAGSKLPDKLRQDILRELVLGTAGTFAQ